MKVEEVLTFDEKNVFNNYGEIKGGQNGTIVTVNFPEEMKRLYEENARLLNDKILLLEEKIRGLERRN